MSAGPLLARLIAAGASAADLGLSPAEAALYGAVPPENPEKWARDYASIFDGLRDTMIDSVRRELRATAQIACLRRAMEHAIDDISNRRGAWARQRLEYALLHAADAPAVEPAEAAS